MDAVMKMYRISREDSEKLRKEMGKARSVLAYRKMEAVALRGEGKKNKEISEITGFHPDMTGRFAKEYLELGIEGLLADGRKGGNHRNASDFGEASFIARFEKSTQKGEIITVNEIAAAYDKCFEKNINRNPQSIICCTNGVFGKSCRAVNTQTAQPQRR
jgi:transposase